eukprot:175914-Alexandrium_andersonii.AAC.1
MISFPITWAVMGNRQTSVTWPENVGDTGMKGKVLEIRPPYEFLVSGEVDTQNPRHKVADDTVIQELSAGKHSAELIFWTRLLFPTLTFGNSRHLQPTLRCLKVFEAEAEARTGGKDTCFR